MLYSESSLFSGDVVKEGLYLAQTEGGSKSRDQPTVWLTSILF